MTWAGHEAALEWAAAGRPVAGAVVSGDVHLVAPFAGGVLAAVIDGLGHGPEAELAARAARDVMAGDPALPVEALMARCHDALGRLRGAVMSVVSFDLARATMTWVGVGNVEAVLLAGRPSPGDAGRNRLLLRGGIVGQTLPLLRPATLPLRFGDVVVFATDGVHSSYVEQLGNGEAVDRIAGEVLARHARPTDDALVLALRYRGDAA